MPEHQKQEAPVAGGVAGALGGSDKLLDFGRNKVFSVAHHFVQCLDVSKLRNASNNVGAIFQL